MPAFILVHGFSAGTLYLDSAKTDLLWVNYAKLAAGQAVKMRLAPNGIDPGEPDGVALYPDEPLGTYYFEAFDSLSKQLAPHGYRGIQFGYDWRKSIFAAGQLLADVVRASASAADPCAIVAHSNGGIAARAAWVALGATHEQALIRRIVTLGTPHQGTYAPIVLVSGLSDTTQQLFLLNRWIGGSIQWNPLGPAYKSLSLSEIISLYLTWPALYELWPDLGGDDAQNDPDRALLYDRTKWPAELPISADWLDYSLHHVDPWLRDPAHMPPRHVLTTVYGFVGLTPWGLLEPDELGQEQAIGFTYAGDGVVTLHSARVLDSKRIQVRGCRHADLPFYCARRGILRDAVLEVRSPPDPPPPQEDIQGPTAPLLSEPPIVTGLGILPADSPCRTGKCGC